MSPEIIPPEKPKQKQLGKTKGDLKRRARRIVKGLIEGQSATEVLKSVGYSNTSATNGKKEIFNNPVIAKTIREIYESGGISDEYLREKHKALLEAKETKFFQEKGIVTDERTVEDNTTRLNALKLAHQIKGNLIERSQVFSLTATLSDEEISRRLAALLETPKDETCG